jgi:hypothetical protein
LAQPKNQPTAAILASDRHVLIDVHGAGMAESHEFATVTSLSTCMALAWQRARNFFIFPGFRHLNII